MSALVKQLRLLQAWYLPAGPEPEEAMPSKYRAFKEAADRIVELERDLAAANEQVEMVKDIQELLGVKSWHGCYAAIAELKEKLTAKPDVAGLSFVMEDRGGAMVIDWSAKGGLGCGPADIAHIELYRALLSLSAQLKEKEAELAAFRAENNTKLAEIKRLLAECEGLRGLLMELHTMVKGECPSLLDEDRGGNAALDAAIAARKP